ncbi:alanine racemase [Salinicoccus sediminis]|uniref:Alanine racemase n=1 Tax=Salinicoccus sediminis TaxID=1432562 RepID=A0A0M2SLT1_9STAP|nr:alanine racemase [Salinicoccus sediminis]KKK35644.1 alanine racemase [Salinicoccus sediminis]
MGGILTIDREQFIETAKHSAGGRDVIAVVKNNAYNYGLEFAVRAFWEAGIRSFATTSLDEARHIRSYVPRALIFMMNPVRDLEAVREYELHITLPSLEYYYEHHEALAGINVHLEFAGLFNRSGFEDAPGMVEVMEHQKTLEPAEQMHIKGIWTHFGYADELEMDEYEIERGMWLGLLETLGRSGYNFDIVHSQNSASFARDGILDGHTHLRLGISLYGSRPYYSLPETDFIQSLELKAEIVQIRNIRSDQKCGYGGSYEPDGDRRIAVVDIGYGDGLLRKRAAFDCMIGGRRYPIKSLMMSHMIVEIDGAVSLSDEVVLYSNEMRIDEFTAKGVGANSEQLGALNYHSLEKVILNDTGIHQ